MRTTAASTIGLLIALGVAFLDASPLLAQGTSTWESGRIGKATIGDTPALPIPFTETSLSPWKTLDEKTISCPSGSYAIGVKVWAGDVIDAIDLECARLGPEGQHQQVVQARGGPIGGNSGTLRTIRCPAGKVLHTVRGRAAEVIDRVQFGCRPWREGTGAHGSTQWLAASGGNGGDAYGPVACPDGMAIERIKGSGRGNGFATFVGIYSFRCRTAPPATVASSPGGATGSPGVSPGQPTRTPGQTPVASPPSGTIARPGVGAQPQLATGSRVAGAATTAAAAKPRIASAISRSASRGNSRIEIGGKDFIIFVNGRQTQNVQQVLVNGAPVKFEVVSAERIVLTLPDRALEAARGGAPTLTLVSGTERISSRITIQR